MATFRQAYGTTQGGALVLTVAQYGTWYSGDLVLMYCRWGYIPGVTGTITDPQGNVWTPFFGSGVNTLGTPQLDGTGAEAVQVWWTILSNYASYNVTVTFSTNVAYPLLGAQAFYNYSGNPLTIQGKSAVGSPGSSPDIVVAAGPGTLLSGFIFVWNEGLSTPSGWTLGWGYNNYDYSFYIESPAAGNYNINTGGGSAGYFSAIIYEPPASEETFPAIDFADMKMKNVMSGGDSLLVMGNAGSGPTPPSHGQGFPTGQQT